MKTSNSHAFFRYKRFLFFTCNIKIISFSNKHNIMTYLFLMHMNYGVFKYFLVYRLFTHLKNIFNCIQFSIL